MHKAKRDRPMVVAGASGKTHILGMRRAVLSDLYYFFMKRSWVFVFGMVVGAYLLVNALFGALYMLDSGGIVNARPDSFLDHFFFSVQTASTVGYGYMYPKDHYINTIMTLECIVAMMGVAMVTGLVFAKFSRPRARVIFSSKAVISNHDGVPTLMFRVANERANYIADVTMTVSFLRTYKTLEGRTFTKIVDVPMVRNRSSILFLTWTVMHQINEASPFFGQSSEAMAAEDAFIVCSLIGHDSTMGHTIHARHLYTPDNIVWKHRLADILHSEDDSDITVIDYHNFHTIESDAV